MTNEQQAILAAIDANAQNFAKNVVAGAKTGISTAVMEAHVCAYITKNLYSELLKANMPIPDLFNQKQE